MKYQIGIMESPKAAVSLNKSIASYYKVLLAYLTNNSRTFSEWPTRRKAHLMHRIAEDRF